MASCKERRASESLTDSNLTECQACGEIRTVTPGGLRDRPQALNHFTNRIFGTDQRQIE
jgi:hypothetical protein